MMEKEKWLSTTQLLGDHALTLGEHWSYNFRNDPKRLGFVLSRYKFAAKMACKEARVLELGCSDGIGVTILSEFAQSYLGVDLDQSAVETSKINCASEKNSFIHDDFMGKAYGEFDAVVSLDVIEHILPEYEDVYFKTCHQNLSEKGICVIGTPNITSAAYASKLSQIGHVNLYSQERLVKKLKEFFHQVLPFGMNDEIMHTGFGSMAHYLLCVAFHKKELHG